jgi:hypothetical protein
MLKRTQFSPRTLAIFAALLLALVVLLCACSPSCESYDNAGRCCTSRAHGVLGCG